MASTRGTSNRAAGRTRSSRGAAAAAAAATSTTAAVQRMGVDRGVVIRRPKINGMCFCVSFKFATRFSLFHKVRQIFDVAARRPAQRRLDDAARVKACVGDCSDDSVHD
jgi:hypothetical protein